MLKSPRQVSEKVCDSPTNMSHVSECLKSLKIRHAVSGSGDITNPDQSGNNQLLHLISHLAVPLKWAVQMRLGTDPQEGGVHLKVSTVSTPPPF